MPMGVGCGRESGWSFFVIRIDRMGHDINQTFVGLCGRGRTLSKAMLWNRDRAWDRWRNRFRGRDLPFEVHRTVDGGAASGG
jgi:hypothetical protein